MARMSQGLPLPSGNRGLLIIAALAGLAAAVLFVVAVQNNDSNTSRGTSSGGTGNAVVAADHISAGKKIEAGMVTTETVSDRVLVPGAMDDMSKVTPTRIGTLPPASCGLACVVPFKSRGSAIQVKEVTAVGGLLYAGNRVDIIAASKVENDGSVPGCEGPFIWKATVLLQNVEVLSVGQEQQKPEAANSTATDQNSGTSGQTSDLKQQPGANTITLALSPRDVMVLSTAHGDSTTLWTALRANGDNEILPADSYSACYYGS
jgi:Flp pilus assembly protein CpaB